MLLRRVVSWIFTVAAKRVTPVFTQRKWPHMNIEAAHSFQKMAPSTKPHGNFHGHTHRNVNFRRDCYEERITREILCIRPFQKRQGRGRAYKGSSTVLHIPEHQREKRILHE